MKRILGLILAFCLVVSLFSAAVAEPDWEISKQPTYKTTKKNITISIKLKGKTKGVKYQWIFINPEDSSDTYVGKELADKFPGIKITGENKDKVVISKVPEDLHCWLAYCHLTSGSDEVDSDQVAIGVYGNEPPEQPKSSSSDDDDKKTDEDEYVPEEFTVTANGNYLYKIDSMGNSDSSEGVSSLTFTGSGNVAVRSDAPFSRLTVNGIPFELEKGLRSLKIMNLSANTSISVEIDAGAAASENETGSETDGETGSESDGEVGSGTGSEYADESGSEGSDEVDSESDTEEATASEEVE